MNVIRRVTSKNSDSDSDCSVFHSFFLTVNFMFALDILGFPLKAFKMNVL